jgi:hypothetical protein
VIIAGGSLRLPGGTLATVRVLSGTLSSDADLTVSSSLFWSGGVLAGSGRLILASAATLEINGDAAMVLARPIENSGTVNWMSGSVLVDGGSFLNRPNAVFNASAEGLWRGLDASDRFTNAGTLNKTTGSAASLAIAFDNAGSVRVQAGQLTIAGDGAHTGGFIVSGKLILVGVHTCSSTAAISGAGALVIGGALTSAGGFSLLGQVIVTGQASLTGAVSAGPVSIQGGSLSLGANSTLASMYNAGALSLANHTLTLAGAYSQASAGALNLRMDGSLPAQYGRIAAAGTVTLAGSVHVSWGAPFYPYDGTVFDLASGSSRTGTFGMTTADSLGPNRLFLFSYTLAAARLTVRARLYEER